MDHVRLKLFINFNWYYALMERKNLPLLTGYKVAFIVGTPRVRLVTRFDSWTPNYCNKVSEIITEVEFIL